MPFLWIKELTAAEMGAAVRWRCVWQARDRGRQFLACHVGPPPSGHALSPRPLGLSSPSTSLLRPLSPPAHAPPPDLHPNIPAPPPIQFSPTHPPDTCLVQDGRGGCCVPWCCLLLFAKPDTFFSPEVILCG